MLSEKNKKRFRLKHWQVIDILLIAYDILTVTLSYFLVLWLRFDCRVNSIDPQYLKVFSYVAPVYAVLCIIVFTFCKLYRSIWRFASVSELLHVLLATGITTGLQVGGCFFVAKIVLHFESTMPLSYYVIGPIFQFFATLCIRFSYRLALVLKRRKPVNSLNDTHHVMVIGAGEAARALLKDIAGNAASNDKVFCIIDDNSNKWNRYVEGVPVIGGREDILNGVKRYNIDRIYIAIPSASAENKRDILQICKETGCELKQLPGLYQLVNGQVTVSNMRAVSIEDLLGRPPIKQNLEGVFGLLKDKVILVTGGGGSIGSELCRQIAAHQPKQLIIFDIYENSAYDIQNELKRKYPDLNLTVCIGSVRDSRRLKSLFSKYRPEIVFHAAAHKHVPLMENSPCEAIKNNAVGTYKTAYAAAMYGCKRFVLISTDKAVNPTNIMGASKRICEMIVQSFDRKIKAGEAGTLPQLGTHTGSPEMLADADTEFVAVRFGNVLGSNGSVIPLFKKQIEQGGPITVTHPDIIRYFMTIPEAVSLVLQAGAFAKGGEIFVLDMGSPVKIDDLAKNLIKLSGLRPNEDIKIVYTGLRPGEKLYEEKLMAEEGLRKTDNNLIHIGLPIPFDEDEFLIKLVKLADAAYNNSEDIVQLVSEIVSTFHPQ